ncbi:MAG: S8 family serine peptidase, partial [Cyclobacteriaceae bacterium]|nr:S8 family serine peptidase [Cyclobacteriaceae bacterium]
MANGKLLPTLICCLLILQMGVAQDRYMVFFSDKNNSPFAVDQPADFLSARSIERRQKQGISVVTQDLPVNASYIQQVAATGAAVYFSSRWMNAVLVEAVATQLDAINLLTFVDSTQYVAKGTRLLSSPTGYTVPTVFAPPVASGSTSDLQVGMLDVDNMHLDGYRGENMVIAVLDGGFMGADQYQVLEKIHTENRLLDVQDFVRNSGDPFQYSGHGTSVLSTMAAEYTGFTGTAPKAAYLLYVTEDVASEYRIEEYNWLFAAERADSAGADIIHTSVGYRDFTDATMNYQYADLNGQTAVITRAANLAFERGMVVVTSAGNEGNSSVWPYVTYPADGNFILAVGSITSSYQKSSFSSIGPTADGRVKPDVMALGTQTTILSADGFIGMSNGTSYSAPLVSGFVAGLWQAHPEWTNRDVVNTVRMTSSRALQPDMEYGYGVPSYRNAVLGNVLSVNKILNENVTVY